MYQKNILPFYMTYPLPLYEQEEDVSVRDLEYLQQMYPAEAKKYQKIIAGILDKLDYEGSMIYDEYPDRWRLYKLSQDILQRIRSEEEKNNPKDSIQDDISGEIQEEIREEKWKPVSDLIQLILFYEIYKRRQERSGRKGTLPIFR